MTGYVYCLCILCTLLSGVHASLIVHNNPLSWKAALRSCAQNKQTLLHGIDEHLTQQLRWCMNGEDLTFWTGGYTTNTWISFRGCFDFNNHSMYILNKSQSNSLSSCHQFCGRHTFGITINTCVCLNNSILHQHQTPKKHYHCIQTGDYYIGTNRTIAIYKPIGKQSVILQRTRNSSCSVYMCNGSRYKFNDRACTDHAQFKCDNDFTTYQAVTWDEALSACFRKGSYLTGPLPNSSCRPHSNIRYWSYVRRYREHKYVTRDSTWGSEIEECEITHLNGGFITVERTENCKNKRLPFICQSDDGRSNFYIDSILCNFQNYTTKISHPTKSSSPMQTMALSSTNSGQNERQTSSYLETTATPIGNNKNISDTRTQFASKGIDTTDTNGYTTEEQSVTSTVEEVTPQFCTSVFVLLKGHGTGATQSGEEIVHTTNHFTQDSSTHSVRNMMASKKESRVGLIGGVVAACVVAVVAIVVISVFCSRRYRKNKHKEKENVTSSKERCHSWPDTKQYVEQGEINMKEVSLADVELYNMSGEGEYDHLRSNNRKIKKEAESMYDTTAQVKAEEEMYSSTRQGNNYVESSDFYDSMQRIQNEDENIYDHSITDSAYSQTAAPRFAISEY